MRDDRGLRPWLAVEELRYRRVEDHSALLQLLGTLECAPTAARGVATAPRGVTLAARSEREHSLHRPFASGTSGRLWVAMFVVPLEVVERPARLLRLVAHDRATLVLPAPRPEGPDRLWPGAIGGRIRRHLLALAAGLAVATACGTSAGVAAAATTRAPVTTNARLAALSAHPRNHPCKQSSSTMATSNAGDGCGMPAPGAHDGPRRAHRDPKPHDDAHPPHGHSRHAHAPAAHHRDHPAGHAGHGRGHHHRRGGPADDARPHKHVTKNGAPRHGAVPTSPPAPARHAPAALPATPAHHATPPLATVPAATTVPAPTVSDRLSGAWNPNPFPAAQFLHLSSLLANGNQPPGFLIPIYKAAARRYHVPWKILAAINSIETNYGRNLNVSSAGAIGWMQFMPSTWRMYGVAADGHGRPNPYDPWDAIFGAARYLAASGARHDLRRAIFAYNHADWYVEAVLLKAQAIADRRTPGHAKGYALPLAARYMRQLGRTDDGVDIETAPDGALVYSITPGVVSAVASDPSGFGPDYPVVVSTQGPLAGKAIYYGHVALSIVRPGEHVRAGQPIAVMGHTGDAADAGHGHIEIGFSNSVGDPLDHHGAVAWTSTGAAMRRLLVALSALKGIRNA